MTEPGNRRERVRAATITEIKDTARAQLVAAGPAAISLRAIARDMGMTAPGLYRYFPNLEALVDELSGDFCDDLRIHLEEVLATLGSDQPSDQIVALCRGFRSWSKAHPAEFTLIFGARLPGIHGQVNADSAKRNAGMKFAGVFARTFAAVWEQAPFPIPTEDELPAGLADQHRAMAHQFGRDLPVGALHVFLSCWVRLYGSVAIEIFDHLHFALTDPEPMFEAEVAGLAHRLGLPTPALPALQVG